MILVMCLFILVFELCVLCSMLLVESWIRLWFLIRWCVCVFLLVFGGFSRMILIVIIFFICFVGFVFKLVVGRCFVRFCSFSFVMFVL